MLWGPGRFINWTIWGHNIPTIGHTVFFTFEAVIIGVFWARCCVRVPGGTFDWTTFFHIHILCRFKAHPTRTLLNVTCSRINVFLRCVFNVRFNFSDWIRWGSQWRYMTGYRCAWVGWWWCCCSWIIFLKFFWKFFLISVQFYSNVEKNTSSSSVITDDWIQSRILCFLAERSTVVSIPCCASVDKSLFFSSGLLWNEYIEAQSSSGSVAEGQNGKLIFFFKCYNRKRSSHTNHVFFCSFG